MNAATLAGLVFSSVSFFALAADPLPRAKPESVGMSSARLARIVPSLKADVDQGRIQGAVVAVARKGKLVYYEAVGWRDKDASAPMARDTIFSIASMTKPMASVALMQLFEEGTVMVTDPVGKHLPMLGNMRVAASLENPAETVPAARQMTVQDILRHTSGLLYGGRGTTALHKLYPASSSRSGTSMTGPEFLAKLASLPLAYQPGKVWDYSLSVDVVGLVVEAKRGKALGEVLQRAPLEAARNDGHVVHHSRGKTEPLRALVRERSGKRPGRNTCSISRKPLKFECGGGCAASTAGDYLRFAQMLLDKGTLGKAHILGKKTVEYMSADHLTPDIDNRITVLSPALANHGFGLGFAVQRSTGMAGLIGSEGEYFWSGAYGTFFWVDPKEQMVVVLMSHTPGDYRGTLRAKVGAHGAAGDRQVVGHGGAGGRARSARQRDDGLVVAAGAHLAVFEDAVLGDPALRVVEGFARVGLEHDALARAPAARVHLLEEARREFVAVVVRVALGPQVDVALRAAQRAEILLHVLRVHVARDHGGDHEGGVDDLAEAELLGEVVRAAEQRRRRHLAVDQLLQAAEQHAVGERQLDLLRLRGTAPAPGSSSSGCPTGSRPRSARPSGPAASCTGDSGGTNTAAGATE